MNFLKICVKKTRAFLKQILLILKKEKKEEVQLIIQHWIRIFNIKLGWIHDFDKLVVNYVIFIYIFIDYYYLTQMNTFFIFEAFRSSSKLLNTLHGHTNWVNSIDFSTFDDIKLLCSGSSDKTVRVWDLETNKQIQLFDGHLNSVYCVRFSQYYYHNNHSNVICSSSDDQTVRFWDVKENRQINIFNGHTGGIFGIELSPFNGGRYLCSGSVDKTMRLWDVETSKSLHVFNGHTNTVWCVDFSPLQNNSSDKNNNMGVIGGNGYTLCSGSHDKTICIWDIETTKQLIVFKGHEDYVRSVKYGSNKLGINGGANTILSGSRDKKVRLWDIRSGQQIQVFNGHTNWIRVVEYSPFVVNNNEIGGNSNVICSGSLDDTIRFWDIRSNKNELYVIKGEKAGGRGILCLRFLQLKKNIESTNNRGYDINLYYGSCNSNICIWG
ncbi:WD repeat-containing protein [Reticulomyxa filosa]|uniref:WD repeat-containing protein n=1 Tax=Reticulomyxa filosa TaxID=46433 RepID=X6MKQ2_RETFI|nr:WD repeat-containing protein [Reticulomyxa filosa]|eukprot:ETO14593.1 WD repeat-containing protein [Reticulomyxa filosa]